MGEKHDVFETLKKMDLAPSPYLKTRVLAELASRRRERRSLLRWKLLAACSLALSLALLVFQHAPGGASFQVAVGQAFVVHIEVEPLRQYQVAEAEIDLPRGVEFYSKDYPELSRRKSLRMAWNDKQRNFPVVLRAVESGLKSVKVLFFDHDHNLVSERTFNIDLTQQKSGDKEKS